MVRQDLFFESVIVFSDLRIHTVPKIAHSSLFYSTEYLHPKRSTIYETGPQYRFMIVRHPLERIVSLWAFCCMRDQESPLEAQGYKKGQSFDEFFKYLTKNYLKDLHTIPQVEFTGGHKIDKLVRLEDLKRGWQDLTFKFPYLPNTLGHANPSTHDVWQAYYSEANREVAEFLYAEDIELYDEAEYGNNGTNPR